MPIVLASLLGGLINIAGTIAGRVLIGLGISIITYSGISVGLGFAKDQALSAIHGMPAEYVAMLSYIGMGNFISIISSAMIVRLTLDGLTDGTVKKWVMK